ncbi:E1 subunit of 2-oxoglutarate dehydrogenase [Gonapodya prolifera JEL478]|uniref:2-oxoglutarate dehydrogenase, mitochondrial n=1 Tax=Gonapodya prolifera (strain JEL478) TaxID=1344416 RepID=A0A139AFJ8_GONPJ|nr:E1 subunit of 2-oxoglutarate dehydrogenase [Gonapodya prolifera JEL478]|eukprot:KXS15530.1 E1 subunit of 2-oxoglutarate dehydrogenase [Gonapodya prolifera JEL478]
MLALRPIASVAARAGRGAGALRGATFARTSSASVQTSFRALATAVPGKTDDFLKGASAAVLENLYDSWRRDTKSVDPKWDEYFNALEQYQFMQKGTAGQQDVPLDVGPVTVTPKMLEEHKKVMELIRSYRVFGHLSANLDPLGLWNRPPYQELDYQFWGFTEQDLGRKFYVGAPLAPGDGWLTLGEIVAKLKYTYADTLGVEYMHIQDVERKNWIERKLEQRRREFTPRQRWVILNWLTWADRFEGYLAKKYPFTKRFGLEGAEALIPCIEGVLERASSLGLESAVVGMAHRGRLNVLANVLKKPMYKMFAEFEDKKGIKASVNDVEGSGDVMYHLGASGDRVMFNGKEVHLSLVANPSHLEAADGVVEGKARAKQFWTNDYMHEKHMAIQIHGDAAFAGQGVVAETLMMQDLPDYTTGGTVHIIVNNQIGFTTNPKFSRSSPYPTDLAKGLQCPVLHVNGDDPEAVVWASETAAEYRMMFKDTVVVDIFCYRKQGHNEIDEPMFTQPIMYKKIAKHTPTLDLYRQRLLDEKVLDEAEIAAVDQKYLELCETQYSKSSDAAYESPAEWLKDAWSGMLKPSQLATRQETGVEIDELRALGQKITEIPSTIRPHRKIAQLYQQRRAAIEKGTALDWGVGEQLAFASLVDEGYHVRLSGQDSERGTFSHRHSVIYDQETEQRYIPIANVKRKPDGMSLFNVMNSPLSEYGVLGFEYGYSLENPNALVMWEAQFGDFANGAQIIVDQFLSSAEHKWYRQSGLVMMLPHGYEGQGPEHSSSRLERYLQLVSEEPHTFPEYTDLDPQSISKNLMKQTQSVNYVVAVPTTPANLFHLLRRQVHRLFRKPLIMLTPKSLLKAPYCVSKIEDFAEGTRVMNIIPEVSPEKVLPDEEIKRIIFCTGKVYYDIAKARDVNAVKDTCIVRIEQLAPFPFHNVLLQLRQYPNADVVWCQEEPRNQGAWTFVRPRLNLTFNEAKGREIRTGPRVRYAGRAPSASPATGSKRVHYAELEAFLADAFGRKDDSTWVESH